MDSNASTTLPRPAEGLMWGVYALLMSKLNHLRTPVLSGAVLGTMVLTYSVC